MTLSEEEAKNKYLSPQERIKTTIFENAIGDVKTTIRQLGDSVDTKIKELNKNIGKIATSENKHKLTRIIIQTAIQIGILIVLILGLR